MMILSACSVAALVLAPVVVQAQVVAPPPNVTLDLRDVSVRVALEQVFRAAKVDFGIDPAVTGFVTLKVTDVPFESALRLVMRSSTVPLTYLKDGGVYLVKPRTVFVPDAPVPTPTEQVATRSAVTYDRIEFTYADPLDFAGILNIQMIPIFTRQGLGVPGATGILRPGAPGTRNGNGGVVGSGTPTAPGAPPPKPGGGGTIVGF